MNHATVQTATNFWVRLPGSAGPAAIDINPAMLLALDRFATLLASLSVPVFTGHLSVPHANAGEPDTSSTMAPQNAGRIVIPCRLPRVDIARIA